MKGARQMVGVIVNL